MSTLNRALAKIYGLTDDCPEASNAHDDDHSECSHAGSARHDGHADLHAGSVHHDDELPASFDSSPVLELPETSFRIDGPVSNVVEPPHLELADVDPIASNELPPAEESARVPTETAERYEPQSPGLAVTLSPEWEVDRFRWPATCQQLLLEKDEAFESAIESLCSLQPEGHIIAALVGESSGDGVSTAALCIARQAAQLGKSVLLVDVDISEPKLATSVGLNTPCSWHDSVSGDVPLAESIVVSVEDRLSLMPLHVDCQQSSLNLSDERVAALLCEACEAHDLVILDCGSIDRLAARVDDGGHLPCDVAVVVRDASREPGGDPDKVPGKLRSLGIENILFVENFVREPKPAAGKLQNSAA